jgi:dUTP pyrophosphatase
MHTLRPYPNGHQPLVQVKKMHPDAKLPKYAHDTDAGADLSSVDRVSIPPGHRALVHTGIALNLPQGWYARVRSRSGLGVKKGVEVGIGTIDEGYTGEVMVLVYNHDPYEHFEVAPGDRIAQMLVLPYWQAAFEEVEELPAKTRGSAGFGSTGVSS